MGAVAATGLLLAAAAINTCYDTTSAVIRTLHALKIIDLERSRNVTFKNLAVELFLLKLITNSRSIVLSFEGVADFILSSFAPLKPSRKNNALGSL